MVMEYLVRGDLLGYLRKSRGFHDKYHLGQGSVSELQIYDLVLFAKQIAAGMVFLGSRGVSNHLKKCNNLRAILQESEAKLEMKIFNPPSFFGWR